MARKIGVDKKTAWKMPKERKVSEWKITKMWKIIGILILIALIVIIGILLFKNQVLFSPGCPMQSYDPDGDGVDTLTVTSSCDYVPGPDTCPTISNPGNNPKYCNPFYSTGKSLTDDSDKDFIPEEPTYSEALGVYIGEASGAGSIQTDITRRPVKIKNSAGTVTERVLTASEIAKLASQPLPLPNPVLHLKFDSDAGAVAKDSSGKGNDLTISGATWTPEGKIGGAYKFDGIKSYMSHPDKTRLGATKYTVMAWVKRAGAGVVTDTGTGGVKGEPLVTKGRGEADGSNKDMNYFMGIRQTDKFLVADFESTETANNNYPIIGASALTDNQWNHVAVSYDGAKETLYINGVRNKELSVVKTPRGDSIQPLAVGTALNSLYVPAGYFKGVMDEVRFYDTALTAGEIGRIFSQSQAATLPLPTPSPSPSASASPSTSPSSTTSTTTSPSSVGGGGSVLSGPVLDLRFDSSAGAVAKDSSGKGNDLTISGATWIAEGKKGGAYRFEGDDYMYHPDKTRLDLAKFTLVAWVKRAGAGFTASTGNGGVVAEPLITNGMGEADGDNRDMNYFMGIRPADKFLVADFEDTASGANHPVIGASALTDNQWYHVAVSYDGAKWAMYINGVKNKELSVAAAPRSDSIQYFAIATAMNSQSGRSGYFNGVMDEIKVYDRALSESEIKTLYSS